MPEFDPSGGGQRDSCTLIDFPAPHTYKEWLAGRSVPGINGEDIKLMLEYREYYRTFNDDV